MRTNCLHDEGALSGELVETPFGKRLAGGHEAKLRRLRVRLLNRALGAVEELAQRDCPRRGVDYAQPPVVGKRRNAVLVHEEASVDDQPRRNRPNLRQQKCVADGNRRDVGGGKHERRDLGLARQRLLAD